ncbi:MAG TPA: glutathione S-transferase family protein [Steroidobacteraceae bacterium]|jgi:glutathione S-transferase
MSDAITFYYHPMSRARMVHWMLEEVGAPYRIEIIDLQKGEQRQPKFLAINPMGKLPAITHRGTTITETGAICAYLADAFPKAALAPPTDDPARGTYLRWMFFGAGCVDTALMDRMLERPVPERTSALGYGRYEDFVATLEKALTPGPYILGDRISAADIYLGAQIGFGLMIKALEPTPKFSGYSALLTARPAYQRAQQQSEELVAQMKKAV